MKKIITLLTLAFAINVNAQCPFTISGDTVICAGGQTLLNANPTYTVGLATYNWQPGGFNGQSFTAMPNVTTTYTVTETVGTCTNVNVVTVTVLPGPAINASASPTSVCIGNSATLTASGASSYTWSPGGANTSSIVVTPNVTTTYNISGPAGSCPAQLTLYVGSSQPFTITGNTQVCAGNSTTLMASTTYTTGGNTTYIWQPGSLNSNNVTITPSASTMYTVTENAGGCVSIDTITVHVNSGPVITISAAPAQICAGGGSATLTASGSSSYTWSPGSATTSSIVVTPTVTTTYTVAGSAGSCNGIFTLNVYSASPIVNYTLNPSGILHTWDASPNYPSNVDSARWYWGDGSSTTGLSPSHTYSVAGTYSICVTAYTSCGDSTSYCQSEAVSRLANNNSVYSNMIYVYVIYNQTLGITQIASSNKLNIYPNPSNGNFTIESQNTLYNVHCTVYDVNGKQVLTQTINGKTTIDASNLAEGVYNLSVISNEGVVNKRLVIVK